MVAARLLRRLMEGERSCRLDGHAAAAPSRGRARGGARGLGCAAPRGLAPYAPRDARFQKLLRPPLHPWTAQPRSRSVHPVQRIRVVDASVALWVVVWLLAGGYVFVAVRQLQDYG